MSLLSNNCNRSTIKGSDFQKCGEIIVAPKTNIFMMSCIFCQDNTFTTMQSFMRHLYQGHSDKIKFHSSAAAEVYAVEELVNRTLCGDESEESGVAEDYLKWSDDEEDGYGDLQEKDKSRGRLNIKGENDDAKAATLANMSILDALENCDVSLNFVENMDTTIVAEKEGIDDITHDTCQEEKQVVQEVVKKNMDIKTADDVDDECDEGMDLNEDDDCDMNSTLLKRIQLDLELGNDETDDKSRKDVDKEKPSEDNVEEAMFENAEGDEDLNTTLTEDNVRTSLNTSNKSKKAGLKSLLCGLEDLDDVDDLLENIEDSFIYAPNEEEKNTEKSTLSSKKLEVEDTEDDLYTRLVQESLCDTTTQHFSNEEQESQKSDEHKTVSQNRIRALELQLMADLDMDENDLEVCLNITREASRTPKSNRKSVGAVLDPKIVKLDNDVDVDNITNGENDIKQIINIPKSIKDATKSGISSKKDTKKTPTTRTPKTAKYSDGRMSITGCHQSDNKSHGIQVTTETQKSKIGTPKSRKTIESRRKSVTQTIVMEAKEIVDTNKFEEGLTEENSSTLVYPRTKETPIESQKQKDNSLQSLLDKELNGGDDLDLLINQLETSTSSRDSESELNKTIICEETKVEVAKQAVDGNVEADMTDGPAEELDDEDAEMAIFNKFIGVTSEDTKEKEEDGEGEKEETVDEDADNFENRLNDDLTKALEMALCEEDVGLENMRQETMQETIEENLQSPMEEEIDLSFNDTNLELINVGKELLQAQEVKLQKPTEEEEVEKQITTSPSTIKSKNSPQTQNINTKRDRLSVSEDEYQGKYSKTNKKAKHIQGKPIIQMENNEPMALKETNFIPLSPKLTNKTVIKNPLRQHNSILHPIKGNNNAFAYQVSHEKQRSLLKTLSPLKSKDNQENSPVIKPNGQKTPTSHRIKQTAPQLRLSQIKRERATPARGFINTDRGERTPLKVEDLFMKQSPKSQEKLVETRTPLRGEDFFLKQSPKTQEKSGQKYSASNTPKTPEDNLYKKSPSQCKMNLNQANLLKTPTATKHSPPKIERLKTPIPTKISPPKTSLLKSKTPATNVEKHLTTPQKTRNLTVKVQRYTPTKNKQHQEKELPHPSETEQTATFMNTSPLSASEKEFVANKFKLPIGITISKVPSVVNTYPTMVEVTPSRSNYCKQNFTELSLQQQTIEENTQVYTQQTAESPTKNVPTLVTITELKCLSSRLRARQASIDIVSDKYHQSKTKTPKPGNLDYKSYAVNRSARKKEVLQKMRHIKKQIFKSIATDNELVQATPLLGKKAKRSKIQIENVEILPNIKKDIMTPLLNTQNLSPQLPSPQSLHKTSPTILKKASPKMLKQIVETISRNGIFGTPTTSSPPRQRESTVTLKTPTKSSPTTKIDRPITLKRTATSPLQDEERTIKKAHKSSSPLKREIQKKTTELEATQLGLSDSVVDFLQRDLKANRINVDSLLREEMPVDDAMADETDNSNTEDQAEVDGIATKIAETVKKNNTAPKDGSKDGRMTNDVEKLENNVTAKESTKKEVDNKAERDLDKVKCKDIVKEASVENNGESCTANNSEASILNDLLEQVGDEQKSTESTVDSGIMIKTENTTSTKYAEDYDDTKDLQLLEKVGLQIIKISDIEDFQTIEEVEETEKIAQRFANVCKALPKVFSSKQAETEATFKLLLSNINQVLKTDLTLRDVKRLVNLIVMWYANCYNNKLVEKKTISDTTNKYLMMFHYIPKTIKRLYYCEFCEDCFNTEHRYYTHRIVHTGAQHPYRCKNCHEGFNRMNKQKIHESTCKKELKNETVSTPKTFVKQFHKSQVVGGHNKPNVKTVYNCAKCEMSFNLEADVKVHMALCSRSLRRQPKMCTPRPKAKPEPIMKN